MEGRTMLIGFFMGAILGLLVGVALDRWWHLHQAHGTEALGHQCDDCGAAAVTAERHEAIKRELAHRAADMVALKAEHYERR